MKILWIGKKPVSGETGEEIYDRKMIAACRKLGYEIDLFHPEPVTRINEVRNMVLGVPYQRARFATLINTRRLREVSTNYDVAICSWEPFDGLPVAPLPTVMITHNISSEALPALYPNNILARMAALRARVWERGRYQEKHFFAVGALSKPDLAYLHHINAPNPLLLTPGMPPCIELRANAQFKPEIVISGTYGWPPKRRGIMQFAEEYSQCAWKGQIFADALPTEAAAVLRPQTIRKGDGHIRVGIITDRFEAGHKLKTLAYLANNQIVISFSNVSFDFSDILDHDVFIRQVKSVAQMQDEINSLAGMSDLQERFLRFRNACAARFTWEAVAQRLMTAAESSLKPSMHKAA